MESPANLMMVTAVLGFDRTPDLDRVRDRVRRRVREIPRLRQRVEARRRGRPRWVDVPDVDLSRHVRHSRLEHDGHTAVWDRVSRLMSTPLDRDKPLWTLDIIEQPSGGGVLLARLHHSIGDGIALMLVLLSLTDTDRTGADDNPLMHLFDGHADLRRAYAYVAELLPGGVALMQRGRGPKRRTGPRSIARAFHSALELLRLQPDPPSPLRGPLQPTKRAAWSRPLSLSRIKALTRALDCTINDLMTALVAGALRRYLETQHGTVPSGLRVAVPINLRKLDAMAELGNRFGLLFVPLPVDVPSARERVAEARRRIDALRGSMQPIVTFGILNLLGAGPPMLEDRAVDFFAKKITAVMSNVPGPVRTLYLGGQPIRSLIFWVPQTARVGLGISVSSYAGRMWVAVAADARLLEEPAVLVECFHDELDALDAETEPATRSLF